MSNVIIPATAAAAGWFIGGPTGASMGWMIGSYADADQETLEAQQIADLRVQTSEYGTLIPFAVGKQRLAGNIIWATDRQEHTTTRSAKGTAAAGPEQEFTTYTASFAIAICVGPIEGISRVWKDGSIIAAAGSKQENLPGTLYTGTDTQDPDPLIESKEGVGNVPAYRGIAYMVVEDFDLGPSGRMPFFSFEVMNSNGL